MKHLTDYLDTRFDLRPKVSTYLAIFRHRLDLFSQTTQYKQALLSLDLHFYVIWNEIMKI